MISKKNFYLCLICLLFLLIQKSLICKSISRGFVGFEGIYCGKRKKDAQCCESRDDNCTASIRVPTGRVRRLKNSLNDVYKTELEMMDYLCYCDRFCNRNFNNLGGNDCCPDYFELCNANSFSQNQKLEFQNNNLVGFDSDNQNLNSLSSFSATEEECFESDIAYGYGQTIKKNCQKCTCFGNRWECDALKCLIQESLLNRIKNEKHTWIGQNYSQFWGQNLSDGFKYRLGTLFPEKSVENMNEILVQRQELPRFFDARNKWPVLNAIPRDQGNCGSSWAFSTVQVAADRLAILTNKKLRVNLSTQQLIDCNSHKQRGCQGGFLDRAWWYIRKLGFFFSFRLVSDDCYPYTSGQTKSSSICQISKNLLSSPNPKPLCVSGSQANSTIFKMTPPYRISIREEDIRTEILTNGPVQATFLVYEDFFMYRRGIYQTLINKSESKNLAFGYHSVKILGWGDEVLDNGKTLKYWICENSWGTNWGENGFFRILRGENHCDIESFVIGAWGHQVKTTSFSLKKTTLYNNVLNLHLSKKISALENNNQFTEPNFYQSTIQPSTQSLKNFEVTTARIFTANNVRNSTVETFSTNLDEMTSTSNYIESDLETTATKSFATILTTDKFTDIELNYTKNTLNKNEDITAINLLETNNSIIEKEAINEKINRYDNLDSNKTTTLITMQQDNFKTTNNNFDSTFEILNTIESRAKTLKSLESTTETIHLTKDHINLITENNDVTTQTKNLITENNDVTTQTKNLITENNDVTTQTKNLILQHEELSTKMQDVTLENEKLTTEIQEVTLENENLTAKMQGKTVENEKLTTEIQDVTLENVKLTTETQDVNLENVKFTTETQDVTLENEKFITKMQNESLKNIHLTAKMQDVTLENENLTTDKFNNFFKTDSENLSKNNYSFSNLDDFSNEQEKINLSFLQLLTSTVAEEKDRNVNNYEKFEITPLNKETTMFLYNNSQPIKSSKKRRWRNKRRNKKKRLNWKMQVEKNRTNK